MDEKELQEPKVRINVEQDANGFFKLEATARDDDLNIAAKMVVDAIVEARKNLASEGIKYLKPKAE